MTFIEIVRVVAILAPEVIRLVKAAEEAMPDGGQGEYKLSIVRAGLEAAYKAGNDVYIEFNTVWPALKTLINTTVLAFNSAQVFKK